MCVFADDIILVALGPKWTEAATIFRLLAPTILVFGIIYPTAWFLQSIGLQERSLKIALVLSPLVICAYLIGLPYGPNGVALAFSTDDGLVAGATYYWTCTAQTSRFESSFRLPAAAYRRQRRRHRGRHRATFRRADSLYPSSARTRRRGHVGGLRA